MYYIGTWSLRALHPTNSPSLPPPLPPSPEELRRALSEVHPVVLQVDPITYCFLIYGYTQHTKMYVIMYVYACMHAYKDEVISLFLGVVSSTAGKSAK